MSDAVDRFLGRVDKLPTGCWIWTGALSRGKGNRKWYGSFRVGKRVVRAHTFAHDVLGGKTCPKGWHRDHLCNLSLCVNPAHIEAVPRAVNQDRKMARKGKPSAAPEIYGASVCVYRGPRQDVAMCWVPSV